MRYVHPSIVLTLGDRRLACELAASPSEQARGLQGVRLTPGTGMLFSWPKEGLRAFHMGHVAYPIDVGFYDAHGRQVRVARGRPGVEEQWRSPAKWVLETRAGLQDGQTTLRFSKPVARHLRVASQPAVNRPAANRPVVNEPMTPDEYWPMPKNNLFRGPNDGDDGTPGEDARQGDEAQQIHDAIKRNPEWTGLGPGQFQAYSDDDPLFGDHRGVSLEEPWSQNRRGGKGRPGLWSRSSGVAPQALVNAGELLGRWVAETGSAVHWQDTKSRGTPGKLTRVVDALGQEGDYKVGLLALDILPASLGGALPTPLANARIPTQADLRVIAEALLTTEGLHAFAAELLRAEVADIVKSDEDARELVLVKALDK